MPAEMAVAAGCSVTKAAEMAASFSKAAAGVAPSGATAITPASFSPAAVARRSARNGTSAGAETPRWGGGVVVETDLDEALQCGPPGPLLLRGDGPLQAIHQRQPVHGMNRMGILGHRFRLLALQLADEVPVESEPGQLGCLRRSLLVPVLADVVDAQRRQAPDVRGRMELGNHDQGGRFPAPA